MASEITEQYNQFNYVYQNTTYRQKSGFIFDFFACGPPEKDSQGNKFDGAYPSGFLGRVKEAFKSVYPINRFDILHVCSGRISPTEGLRLDIDPKYNPDFLCNAEDMFMIPANKFFWTMSDSPYNHRAADKYYDKPLLNKSKMVKEMSRVTKVGGFVAIFDEAIVTNAPRNLKRVAIIGVTVNPNKQIRAFTVYRKMRE